MNNICECGNTNTIGIEDPMVYDGVCAWYCEKCNKAWARDGFEENMMVMGMVDSINEEGMKGLNK